MNHTPTSEQAAILALKPAPGLVGLIDAVAGSGKTTTVEMYAAANPGQRFLYLCFNKAQADEAKARFPRNCDCRTTHSLAFGVTGYPYAGQAKVFGKECRAKTIMGPLGIDRVGTAQAVARTLTNFLQSAQPEIEFNHLPRYVRQAQPAEQTEIIAKAGQLWTKTIDPDDIEIPMPHDGYLKLFQLGALSSGKLPRVFSRYSGVLIDEAQDTNPTFEVLISMLMAAGCHSVILVGDERQSIYQFRGAINMMSRLRRAIEEKDINGQLLRLTESFRYGPRTAGFAAQVLSLDSENVVRIVGRGTDDPFTDGAHCYLARTNAGLVDQVLSVLEAKPEGTIYFAATKAPDYSPRIAYKFDFIRSLYGHFAGQPFSVTDPELKRFRDWNEILRHSAKNPGQDETVDQELAAAVNFVTKHQHETPRILELIEQRCGSPEDAIASFSTAHRAKGLEWDRTTLLDDFPHLINEETGDTNVPDEQELNLLYVAITRGRRWVELNNDLSTFFRE